MSLSADNLVSLAVAVIGGLGAGIGPMLAVLVNVVLTKRGDERLKELQKSAAINLRLTEETHKAAQIAANLAERDVETGG